MWESQVLLTDGQVVFLRVLRFSPTFDERSARYKWNILERAVKPKSKKKEKKKKKKNGKCPKISNIFIPYYFAVFFPFYADFLKYNSVMANSIDHDQTAVWSGSALFAYAIWSDTLGYEILGHLPCMYGNFGIVKCWQVTPTLQKDQEKNLLQKKAGRLYFILSWPNNLFC